MKNPLSILILSPDPAVPGGVSAFVETLKKNLSACEATSIGVGRSGNHNENLPRRAGRLLYMPFKIARAVRRKNFDAVHINPSFDTRALIRDGLILFALRLINYRRVLIYFHGWDVNVERAIGGNLFLRSLLVWLLNGAGRIAVLSPEFAAALARMGVDANKVVYTRTMYDKAPGQGAPPARRTILFMSRFDRRKGAHELLDAFIRIAGEFPDVDLIMAGDGCEKAALQGKARALGNRIAFPGYVTGAAKDRLLSECHLYALPSYYPEGMPVALLEAMAAGKPLLAGAAGGIKYILSEPENGVLLANVTTDAVTAGLRRMLNDPQFCDEAGRRNAAYAGKRFNPAAVTAEIEAIYRCILSEAKG